MYINLWYTWKTLFCISVPGFYFLFRDVTDDDDKGAKKFETFPETILTLFQMTLGEFKVRHILLFCFVLYICTLHSCCPFFQAICITNYLTGVQCKTHINSKKYTIIFLIISNLNKSKKFKILRRMEFFLSQKLNPRQLMIWKKTFMEKNKLSLQLWHMLIETCKARSSR